MAPMSDMFHGRMPSASGLDGAERPFHERDTGRSNFAAFLLGGAVLAGAMLTFLYYDTGPVPRGDVMTTGSIARPAPVPVPTAPAPEAPSVPGIPGSDSAP